MWFDGSLYVAAPPSIWKLTDTDGDGVADQREEWFQGKTLTGCANDLHGPYLGPDGWIYWCKGAFAEQTYERPGKPPFVTRAAHIFRRRPGGTAIEPVMTGGMDNPVDVVFTPGGERIFTATFLEHPQRGRRDGADPRHLRRRLRQGARRHRRPQADRRPHAGAGAPRPRGAGGPDPLRVARVRRRVPRQPLRRAVQPAQGHAPRARAERRDVQEPRHATSSSSNNRDFHPTDVLEDADGSLLVVDTGGWYKLCCPTSQLAKPDVLGAIYRVRRKGAPAVDDPRGLSARVGVDDAGRSGGAARRRAAGRAAAARCISSRSTASAAVAGARSDVLKTSGVRRRRGATPSGR